MGAIFAHPWLVAALVLAGLPWLIEWLFRRRRRQVELPTIIFLLRNKEQKKIKRQDRILLIIRTIVVILLVLSLARPQLRRGLTGKGRERKIVMLLDGTESMNQQAGVTTAFGMAQKQASAILRGVEDAGRVTIARWTSVVDPVVEDEKDVFTAAARVDALRIGLGAGPAGDGLTWARDSLKRAGMSGAEVYVFSDFQKSTWAAQGEAGKAAEAFRDIVRENEVYLVDVGSGLRFNYMLTQLRPSEWVMTVNTPVKFHVEVETWGQPPDGASPSVTFLVDGLKKGVRSFKPERKAVLEFDHRFADPGEHLVEVIVDGDTHLVDNRRTYLCTVPDRFNVLILDETAPTAAAAGDGAAAAVARTGRPLNEESAFLARAIEPVSHPGLAPVSRFTAKVIHPSAAVYENLANYHVAVLPQSSSMDETFAARLEGWVQDGGALWLFLGPKVNVYQYERFLYREGKGLMPCRIGEPVTFAAKGDSAVHLTFGQSPHPAAHALTEFTGTDAGVLGGFQVEPVAGARVVLTLSNGKPAMIERAFGRGRVLAANLTAGVGWTYLPGTIEFPILVQELLRYLVGNPDESVNLEAGQAFEQPVFVSRQHLLLRKPDGRRMRMTPFEKPGGKADAWFVSFAETDQQGAYEMVDVPPGVVPRTRFVVNQISSEGDMTRLSDSEFSSMFGRGGYRWVGSDTPVEDLASKLHAVTDFSPLLLVALSALLAVESYLAWRFGRRRRRVATT